MATAGFTSRWNSGDKPRYSERDRLYIAKCFTLAWFFAGVLIFFLHFLFQLSVIITSIVPQRRAKKHLRLHRNSKCHVGEQLSFKSPRKMCIYIYIL